MFESAAEVLSVRLHALVAAPDRNLVDADDRGVRAFGDRDGIAYMVTVSVADQDEVRLNSFGGGGSGRISSKERINNDLISVGFKPKSSMSIPGKVCCHRNLLRYKNQV